MVHVLSDIVQIVVLSAGANTFLSIDHANPFGHVAIRIGNAQKQGLELKKQDDAIGQNEQQYGTLT